MVDGIMDVDKTAREKVAREKAARIEQRSRRKTRVESSWSPQESFSWLVVNDDGY